MRRSALALASVLLCGGCPPPDPAETSPPRPHAIGPGAPGPASVAPASARAPAAIRPGPAREPLPLRAPEIRPEERTGRALPAPARFRVGGNFTRAHGIWFEGDELRVLAADPGLEAPPEVLAFPSARLHKAFAGVAPPFRMRVAPSGELYVDGCRWLRAASSGKEGVRVGGAADADGCAAFSPSGDRLVVSGRLYAIDRAPLAARELADLEQGERGACSRGAAFDPASARVACPGRKGLAVFDRAGKKLGAVSLGGDDPLAATAAAFSADGKTLVAAGAGFVARFDATSLALRDWFPTGDASPFEIAANADASRVATLSGTTAASSSTRVKLWDAGTGRPFDVKDDVDGPGARIVALAPSGRSIALGAELAKEIVVFDARSRLAEAALPFVEGTLALVFVGDRKLLAGGPKSLALFDLDKREVVARAERPGTAFQSRVLRVGSDQRIVGADGRLLGADDLRTLFEARYMRRAPRALPRKVTAAEVILIGNGSEVVGYTEEFTNFNLTRWSRSAGADAEPKRIAGAPRNGLPVPIDVDDAGKLVVSLNGTSATGQGILVTEIDNGRTQRDVRGPVTAAFVHGGRLAWTAKGRLWIAGSTGPLAGTDAKEIASVESSFGAPTGSMATTRDRKTLAIAGDAAAGALVFDVP